MPTQFEILVYLKMSGDFEDVAQRAFGVLGGGDPVPEEDAALGGDYFRLSALGLEATCFANRGEMEDEDFSDYPFGLGIVSTFVCPDLELGPAEGPLADYYARMLAFGLDVEVATSFYLGSQDGVDLYEIRAFRRNPQYVPDSGPMTQRVYIAERRTVEYDSEAIDEDFEEDAAVEEDE